MIRFFQLLSLLALVLLSTQCAETTATEDAPVNQPPKAVPVNTTTTIATYETIEVQPKNQSRTLPITGRTQALEQLQLVAEVQGKALATTKLLNEGIWYKKGETLIQIEDTQFRIDLKAQKAQFQSAIVRILSQIQLDYPAAYPDWEKYVLNFDETKLLPALPETSDEQLRYFLSANNLFSTYYNIKSVEEMLPKYQIKAPFSGIITQGQISPGSVINPGVPLATLSRTDVYELKASISSADLDKLKVGQKIKLSHRNTNQSWTGTVNRFSGTIDPGTQAVPVFIRVSGRDLRSGLFLEANLPATSFEQVVALPIKALNRNDQVHLIKDSTIHLQNVQPVHYTDTEVWVKGLQAGQKVITEELLEPVVGKKAIAK